MPHVVASALGRISAAPGANVRRIWSEAFRTVRAETERRAAPLSPEDQIVQSMADASPAKWHRAHTTWFFETFLLKPHAQGYREFDERFGFLFNSYYVAAGPRHARPERGLVTRPNVEEVAAYRAHVDAAVDRLIESADQATLEKVVPIIEIGLHHEQQHQELILMDAKHLLSLNPLKPAYRPYAPSAAAAATPLAWRDFEGGLVEVGHDGEGFAFDNEGPRHRVWLEPFALASRPTNCGEYLAFIEDGGYRRPEFWLSAGWDCVNQRGWTAPLYWEHDGASWRVFTRAAAPGHRAWRRGVSRWYPRKP